MENIYIHNQDGAGCCVSASCSNIVAINNFFEEEKYRPFSMRWLYPRREVPTAEGMNFNNASQLLVKYGGIFENLLPSDNLGEQAMSNIDDALKSYETIGKIYAPKNYIWLENNIESFAQALAQGRPVLMGVAFGNGE